ncbi:CRISPR-associated endonuclease Cas2 [candidate division KSB3 bacterium]|uniref:CRISPR-associated endoribonuclease Cas2 n=1 Tax=candidate division KSB3 bacterium TaxID=2044937 RepID=A0A2G6E337_9BACT|nr:MAG: CRISPR-associated endonuclease Cas2 [candidate division KSB3 bacterium]
MLILVTYDVGGTNSRAGQKRLRHIAETCLNYGLRVQKSVFECQVNPSEWERLRATLLNTYKPEVDSLRFYFLGSNWKRRVEHHGICDTPDIEGTLII